jgi:hypothetical protein
LQTAYELAIAEADFGEWIDSEATPAAGEFDPRGPSMTFHFSHEEGRRLAGIEFASRPVPQVGLLDVRLMLGQIPSLEIWQAEMAILVLFSARMII